MNNKFVRYDKDDVLRIFSDLNEIVVSLDRIGSYWSDRQSDHEYFEITNRFLDDWNVFRKLASARTILGDAFSRELGSDGMEELERLVEDSKYWTLATALDSRTKTDFHCINAEIQLADFDESILEKYRAIIVDSDWSGQIRRGTWFSFSGFWSEASLYTFFEIGQNEPLVLTDEPILGVKTVGLWERDVCEVFIAPDRNKPRTYFEFEVAPTGEWLDLAIDLTSGERVTDWDYNSGMEVAARIEDGRVLMAMKIPWEAFGQKPKAGDVWLGNIFRCVGREPDRGYLAWQPTMTETPNFHVPEAFGEFHFVE